MPLSMGPGNMLKYHADAFFRSRLPRGNSSQSRVPRLLYSCSPRSLSDDVISTLTNVLFGNDFPALLLWGSQNIRGSYCPAAGNPPWQSASNVVGSSKATSDLEPFLSYHTVFISFALNIFHYA